MTKETMESRSASGFRSNLFLESEYKSGPDRFHDGGGAALLPMLGIGQVAVVVFIDVGDGAATWHRWHPVGEQVPAGDEKARSARTADELVRRDEDGVLVVISVGLG